MLYFTNKSSLRLSKKIVNKVPEVTAYFWIIKILCTTVGETVADFLNVSLNFGLTGTSVVTGLFLVTVLTFSSKQQSIFLLSIG